MPFFVIDCSVAVAWYLEDERTTYTDSILEAATSNFKPVAPRIWAYELRNVLLTAVRRNRITLDHATNFLRVIERARIHLTDPVSYDRIVDLAVRHRLTYYDAAYLDLALREALPLASLDDALCNAARAADVPLFRP